MKAILFARVSTKEQEDGNSIPAQVQRLKDYALRNNFAYDEPFTLIESSTKANRKQFNKLISEIRSSKNTIALVADTVDRIQRDFRESVVLDELRKINKVELHFLRENLVISQNSNSADILRWDMAVMFAKSYVTQLSDNVKRSLEQKLKNGQWTGKAPIGYMNVTDDNGNKHIIIDKLRSPMIKLAFEMYSQGNSSLEQISNHLNKLGLRNNNVRGNKISKSYLEQVLRNPFYYGEMKVKETIYAHKYEPIITRWLYDKCDDVRNKRKHQPVKYASKPYIFRGILNCGYCGCTITMDVKKNKYVYLSCTKSKGKCNGIRIRQEVVLKQLDKLFQNIKVPEAVIDLVLKEIKKGSENERVLYKSSIESLRNEYNSLDSKLEIMYEDRLSGRITAIEYDKRVTLLKEKQRAINNQIANHTDADENFLTTVSYLLELSNQAQKLFERSKVEQKRQILNILLSNLELTGNKLVFNLKRPFDLFVGSSESQLWLPVINSFRNREIDLNMDEATMDLVAALAV